METATKRAPYTIGRAQPEDAAALLAYLKIIGGETDNLSFGPEGVPLTEEAERAYLAMQAQSCDHIQLLAKANGEIVGTASLDRKPGRMHHRAEFGISLKKSVVGLRRGGRFGAGRTRLRAGGRDRAGRSGSAQRQCPRDRAV